MGKNLLKKETVNQKLPGKEYKLGSQGLNLGIILTFFRENSLGLTQGNFALVATVLDSLSLKCDLTHIIGSTRTIIK